MNEPWIKLKSGLNQEDYDLINGLLMRCMQNDGITLKLELDYKLSDAKNTSEAAGVLLLCDKKSDSGHEFLNSFGALYKYSEFEMYLRDEHKGIAKELLHEIILRKASNEDAGEVARQNAIYSSDRAEQEDKDAPAEILLLPEEEEKRGMTIYLAESEEEIIGKVHLQVSSGIGGIYGLGVLPEYRGKGYGRAILLKAVEKLKAVKAEQIMLQVAAENEKALSLYKSCGFEETSVMDYFEWV